MADKIAHHHFDVLTWIFLRILGLLFLSAFVSFGVQSLGLIGSHGILPVNDIVIAGEAMLGPIRYWYYPMLFWFSASDVFIYWLPWIGALFSVLLICNRLPRVSMLMLYVLYLSLVIAGRDFMSFQWDALLLEMAVISILLIHFRKLAIWLLRILLFKFFLEGALVKIQGGSTWLALTALNEYFETMPLPTHLAWYAHHLPHGLLSFFTLSALLIELCMPFLIFMTRRLRLFAAFMLAILQIVIALTGNYNFFNVSTLALCFILLDDTVLSAIIPKNLFAKLGQPPLNYHPRNFTRYIAITFTIFNIFFGSVQFYARFVSTIPNWLNQANSFISPLRLVGTYGPFAVITYPRYEIILEGSYDGEHWLPYTFKYKPDVLNKPLSIIIPHQPRLDWQMWFAALGDLQQSPWFSQLVVRLLENSPSVTALLADNPFKDGPPLYVKAEFYEYHFTNREERAATGDIWKREYVNDFLAPIKRRGLFDK